MDRNSRETTPSTLRSPVADRTISPSHPDRIHPTRFKIGHKEDVDRLKLEVSIEQLNERWKSIWQSDSSELDKQSELGGIAATMALIGHLDTATTHILDSYGPGEARCSLLRKAFRFSPDLDQTSKAFALLEFEDERTAGAEGLGAGLAESKRDSQSSVRIDEEGLEFLGEHRDAMVASFAEYYVSIHTSSGDKSELSEAFNVALSMEMSAEAETTVLRKLYYSAPFQCWDHILDSKGETYQLRDGMTLVHQMLRRDAAQTADLLIDSKRGSSLLAPAFTSWMQKDVNAPVRWLEDNTNRVSDFQRDRIYQGIANYSVQIGETDTAQVWSELIADQKLRQRVESKIESAKDVRKP